MYAKIYSAGIRGVDGFLTSVEADASFGLPSFVMVGNLSSSVKEAGDRVRTAIKNSDIEIPAKRVTINIFPGDLRKDGTSFDLPIAISILKSLELIENTDIEHFALIGELGLDGCVLPVKGILSMVSKLKEEGIENVIVPYENAAEANVIDNIKIYGVKTLLEAMEILKDPNSYVYSTSNSEIEENMFQTDNDLDFADVKGQVFVKRACEIAVAGRHNIIICGSAGCGKTMLAKRIPSIMPKLSREENIAISKVYSISGLLPKGKALLSKRPFRSPHHSISVTTLIGGGAYPRPGEVSLASGGVLFLDEIPLFSKNVIETLRQPLEDKYVRISRLRHTIDYPADFMLVAAMNPCPCGHYPDRNKCKCTPSQINAYQKGISKPILERIDICVEADPIKYDEIISTKMEESSAEIAKRVEKARRLQEKRYLNETYKYNSEIPVKDMKKYCYLTNEENDLLKDIFKLKNLSARTYHKILRVARTIADLEESEDIKKNHLMEASSFRGLEEKIFG